MTNSEYAKVLSDLGVEEISEEVEIDIDTEEFLTQARMGFKDAVKDHLAYEVSEYPSVDPDRVRNTMAEIAMNAAREEEQEAERLKWQIEMLQEQLNACGAARRSALRKERVYNEAYNELVV